MLFFFGCFLGILLLLGVCCFWVFGWFMGVCFLVFSWLLSVGLLPGFLIATCVFDCFFVFGCLWLLGYFWVLVSGCFLSIWLLPGWVAASCVFRCLLGVWPLPGYSAASYVLWQQVTPVQLTDTQIQLLTPGGVLWCVWDHHQPVWAHSWAHFKSDLPGSWHTHWREQPKALSLGVRQLLANEEWSSCLQSARTLFFPWALLNSTGWASNWVHWYCTNTPSGSLSWTWLYVSSKSITTASVSVL